MRRSIVVFLVGVLGSAAIAVGAIAWMQWDREPAEEGPSPNRLATDRPCPPLEEAPAPPQLPPGTIEAVVVGEAEQPTSLALAPDGSGDGVLGERLGRLLRVEAGEITDEVLVDLSDDTQDEGDGGLLALAYDPGGGWLYSYRATADRDDVIVAHRVGDDGRLVSGDDREILFVDHPDSIQHHGGAFSFGPDGMLYVGLGDGGGLGDPRENAQDPSTLLGKVLRIDPTPEGEQPYLVPPDNPFVGVDGHAPEVWALGVRNPFRLSTDPETGDLWLGDVGQSCWEELDRLPTGAGSGGRNLGWNHKEGTEDFLGGEVPGEELEPELTYSHRAGWCSIVAGYVPRSSLLPALDGWLLHTDYCKGHLIGLRADDDGPPELLDTGIRAQNPIAILPGPADLPWILTLGGEVLEVRPVG
ncbi:MAG: PQQ-dependent sugar dehydrogenase [Acidimicrobiales bacterium]